MIDYKDNIMNSNLSIYESIDPENENLYIPTKKLQSILKEALIGFPLKGFALRTRSKEIKSKICRVLGYPVPSSFKKSKPKFPGQNFDVYTQKSKNVQIWNEDIDLSRRYVFLKIDENDIIVAVKVISGKKLIKFDKTGTLTKKYQATMLSKEKSFCSKNDSSTIQNLIIDDNTDLASIDPTAIPHPNELLKIKDVYKKLLPMVGKCINYIDAVQERNRGAELHEMVCRHLGYSIFRDNGQFPDIVNQLLEIKLQTSQTIDLGLHSPKDDIEIMRLNDTIVRTKDIRYAIFDCEVINNTAKINKIYVVSGEDFTNHFPLFKGKGTNAKKQLPLPKNFFD